MPLADRMFDLSTGAKAKIGLFILVGWYCYDMAIDNYDMKKLAFKDSNPYREVKHVFLLEFLYRLGLFDLKTVNCIHEQTQNYPT